MGAYSNKQAKNGNIILQHGGYVDLTGMSLEEKQAVADYLSQNHEWVYDKNISSFHNYISMREALFRDSVLYDNIHKNNRTQEVLDAMNNPIKPNTKIKILSPEHSEYVQKLAFEAGFKWSSGRRSMHTKAPYLFFEDDSTITYAMYSTTFSNNTEGYKEIFINTPEAKPSFPSFKVKGCDDMAVREWLAENVTENVTEKLGTGGRSILTSNLNMPYLYYSKDGDYFLVGDLETIFSDKPLPELVLEREIVGYTLVPDPVQTKREELQRKAESIQAELDKINQELDQL